MDEEIHHQDSKSAQPQGAVALNYDKNRINFGRANPLPVPLGIAYQDFVRSKGSLLFPTVKVWHGEIGAALWKERIK
jgi:hypothetical protein